MGEEANGRKTQTDVGNKNTLHTSIRLGTQAAINNMSNDKIPSLFDPFDVLLFPKGRELV